MTHRLFVLLHVGALTARSESALKTTRELVQLLPTGTGLAISQRSSSNANPHVGAILGDKIRRHHVRLVPRPVLSRKLLQDRRMRSPRPFCTPSEDYTSAM